MEMKSGAQATTGHAEESSASGAPTAGVPTKPAAKAGSRRAAAKKGGAKSGAPAASTSAPRKTAAKSSSTASVKAEPVDLTRPTADTGKVKHAANPSGNTSASLPATVSAPASSMSAPSMITQKDASGSSIAGVVLGLVAIGLVLTHPMWTPGLYTTTADPDGWLTAGKVDARLSKEVSALQGGLAALAERQGELTTSLEASRLPGMLLIANLLNDALWDSGPYQRQLNLFVAVADGRDEVQGIIDGLQGHAALGLPTEDSLIASFDSVVTAIITEEQRSGTPESLADQVRDTISSIAAMTTRLRWRLDGVPDGSGVVSTTARAEALVSEGRFAEALEALGTLPAAMQPLYADWAAAVEARDRGLRARSELGDFIVQMAARMEPRG